MTSEKFLETARSQVGVKEIPINEVKYNTWYYGKKVNGSSYPWCVVFVCWCANQVGVLGSLIPKTASSSTMYNWFKKNTGVTLNPKPGYIGFIKNTGSDKNKYVAEHTFIVYEVNGDTITTIEGNIDNRVIKQKRKLDSKILGFGIVNWNYDEVRYVDNVDYEGLNVHYLKDNKNTGQVLPIATRVNVLEFKGNKAIISKDTFVYSAYLSKTIPNYKVVTGADNQGLAVRKRNAITGKMSNNYIAVIKNGTKVKVYKVKGNWSKISPDQNAWCYSKYLK